MNPRWADALASDPFMSPGPQVLADDPPSVAAWMQAGQTVELEAGAA